MDVQQPQAPPVPHIPQQIVVPPSSYPPPQQPAAQPPPPVPVRTGSSAGMWVSIVFFVFLVIVGNLYIFFPRSKIDIAVPVPGRSVHVNRLLLTKPGWLIVSHVSVIEGVTEIAVTALLGPEDYGDFDLPLMTDAPDLVSGDLLYGTLYEDANGNGGYDSRIDKPMRDAFLRPIRVSVRVQ